MWILWALLIGVGVAFWLWGGCTPPAVPKSIKSAPPAAFLVPTTPRCRLILHSRTTNVLVVIRRDCIERGVTTALFVMTNPADRGGRLGGEDAVEILLKFFGSAPELTLVSMAETSAGHPAFLFVVTELTAEDKHKIRRDLRLRRVLPR